MEEEKLDKKLNIGIEEIRNIKMKAEDKKIVLENILNSPSVYEEPIKSPWTFYSFISVLHKNRLVYYGSMSCLVVILGSGIAFASNGSLPGNILYPIKVNVLEPINSTLKFSLLDKAKYESTLAIKRLTEAETLASENKLDVATEKQLNTLLIDHTISLNETLDELNQSKQNDIGLSDDIATNFEAQMNAHAKVLDIIREKKDETKIEQNIQISNTARENAGSFRKNLKNEEVKNIKTDKYIKRKDIVQSIIDSTTTSVNQKDTESLKDGKNIIDDTNKTIDQAKQLLEESKKEEENGNQENAYSKLLDSESSAKEAEIFLQTGLKFKNNSENE